MELRPLAGRKENDGEADALVVLFPGAGVSPASYSHWSPLFPNGESEGVGIIAARIALYPGRGPRTDSNDEKWAPKSIGELVDRSASAVEKVREWAVSRGKRVVLWGHSMGARVAAAVCFAAIKGMNDSAASLITLIPCASHPPDCGSCLADVSRLSAMPDVQLAHWIASGGGVPAEIAREIDLLVALAVPPLKSDLGMMAAGMAECCGMGGEIAEERKDNIPRVRVTVIYGDGDERDDREGHSSYGGWESVFGGSVRDFSTIAFKGGHFFFEESDENRDRVLRLILNAAGTPR